MPLTFRLELTAFCGWPRQGIAPLLDMPTLLARFAWKTRSLETTMLEMPLDVDVATPLPGFEDRWLLLLSSCC
jgi:hypothetical protein